MVAQAVRDRRAWTTATLDDSSHWYYPLPPECLALLERKIQEARDTQTPVTELRLSPAECKVAAAKLANVRNALENGRGFAIIEGVPLERYSPREVQALYWLAGQALGHPHEQNVQGTLLYDVRDTGQDLSQGARFSVTNYESSFHTDSSFVETIVDYVGLLCLQTARSGGVNMIVSGYTIVQELQEHHPAALAVLCRPFHVDRRGGVRPGEEPTVQMPVIDRKGRQVVFRYLRYWIEAGHQKAGVPLTPDQVAALDTLDAVMRRREFWAEFSLRRGDMLFLNNRWLLHNRTAFVDHEELDRRRHLVRLWLRASA
jgi:alpha-ketoglutarate-dependent taurine dioxygenase